jgi:hypothetical protein
MSYAKKVNISEDLKLLSWFLIIPSEEQHAKHTLPTITLTVVSLRSATAMNFWSISFFGERKLYIRVDFRNKTKAQIEAAETFTSFSFTYAFDAWLR